MAKQEPRRFGVLKRRTRAPFFQHVSRWFQTGLRGNHGGPGEQCSVAASPTILHPVWQSCTLSVPTTHVVDEGVFFLCQNEKFSDYLLFCTGSSTCVWCVI